jgi:hypothetical protein
MLPQPVILESQNATSVADGATIERRIRINRSDCESAWNKDPVFGVIGIQSGPRG